MAGTFTQVGTVGAAQTYYDDSLQGETTYYYHVQAFNALTISAPSAVVSATTPLAPLAAPGNVQMSNVYETGLTVSWTYDDSRADGFRIYAVETDGSRTDLSGNLSAGERSRSLQGLRDGWHYELIVQAYSNALGTSVDSASAFATTVLPTPTNLMMVGGNFEHELEFTWSCPVSYDPFNVNYQVLISTDGSNFSFLANSGSYFPYYYATGLDEGTTYWFQVLSVRQDVFSAPGQVSGTTALTVPGGFSASAANPVEANLQWQDRSATETGFVIRYWINGIEDMEWTAYAPVNATGVPIVGLSPETRYDFEIRAFSYAGGQYIQSDKATVSVTTPAVPDPEDPPPSDPPPPPTPVPPSPGSIKLEWTNGTGVFYNAPGHTGTTLNISNLPNDQPYVLEVDLSLGGSWDGDEVEIPNDPESLDNPIGPDRWRATGPGGTLVDDTFTVFGEDFDQSYPERGSAHHFTWDVPAGNSSFSFQMNTVTSQGWWQEHPEADESWTIGASVSVANPLPAPPPPPPPVPVPPPPAPEPTSKPSVWIATQDSEGSESPDQRESTPGPITFMVGRSNTDSNLTVQLFAPAGTANSGDDYTGMPSSVTIPDGEYYTTFTVTPVDDDLYEGDESVYAILKASSAYWLSTAYVAGGMIEDNDVALKGLPARLRTNSDDDNKDGFMDWTEQVDASVLENDLKPVKLLVASGVANGSAVKLSAGGSIRVFASANRTGLLMSSVYHDPLLVGYPSIGFDHTWVLGSDTIPTMVYVEAVYPSLVPDDVKLTLEAKIGDSTTTNEIKSTIIPNVWAEYDSDPAEGFTMQAFDVRREGLPATSLTVQMEPGQGSTAQENIDYQPLARSATIYANQNVVYLGVTAIQDTDVEISKTVELKLKETGDDYQVLNWRLHFDKNDPVARQRYKPGITRVFIDDDDTGPRVGQTYPVPAPMNPLATDQADKDAGGSVRCYQWAVNIAGNGRNFNDAINAAFHAQAGILWDTLGDPLTEDDAVVDAAMMKRVFEALLYSSGTSSSPNLVQGYRCYFNTPVPNGWHRITAYWRDIGSGEYHFATEDLDPNIIPPANPWSWSDKEGWHDATNIADPYQESGTFLGHYLISTPPRDARATP